MMNWWEVESVVQGRMQDRMREAEKERMTKPARGAAARRAGLLSLVADWLNGRFLVPSRRPQEPCCADAGLGQSSGRHGKLIP